MRDRLGDIPLLVSHFCTKFARAGQPPAQISPEALDRLLQFTWPGNIRQLENAIERACITARDGVIRVTNLPPDLAGRPKGPWFKWKRGPLTADCVLMYAQRGHGKRSSYYSDYTFGCWQQEELVPVGKAYFGFTDAELAEIDRFVRRNTTNRFGPVREVVHERDRGLVFEVAFEGLARSSRHKSGLAMRFPRINRIRTDKPAAEADTIDNLLRLVPLSTHG